MEFRKGKPERRHDRRMCPRCQRSTGTKSRCPQCNVGTEARIRIVWYVDGKRQRELTFCWRADQAATVLQRKEADYWRQQDLGVERDAGGTFSDAMDAFMQTLSGCSKNYGKQIRTALNAFIDGFGWERSVTLVTARDITQYKDDGLVYLSPASVRSYMLVLRRFFGFLHDEGWIRRNPAKKVKLPKARKGRDHLRPEEVGLVVQKCWEMEPEVAPIITALVLGGWRKGEIINLRRRDVYLDQGWAYVLEFKGDLHTSPWSPKTESSWRAIPLHPMVVKAFERVEQVVCLDGCPSPWMFPMMDTRRVERREDRLGRAQGVYGDRRSPGTSLFGEKLRNVLTALAIPHVTIHGLRRTFAVLLQEAGAPDTVVRQALGHGTRGVTETHYLPRRVEMVQKWVDAIEIDIPALNSNDPTSEGGSADDADDSSENDCPHIAPSSGAKRPPYLRLVK